MRQLLLLRQIQKLYLNHNYQKLHQIVRRATSSSSDIGQNNAIQTIPYYDKMISMSQLGRGRPNIPEFGQIDDYVSEAGKQVCSGIKEPKQALNEAAAKSAKLLGW